MRMSDEEYFRSCVAKERHLAHLLGYEEVEEYYESAGVLWVNRRALPQWTRDWSACAPLLAQYGIDIHFGKEAGQTESSYATVGSCMVHFSDHPSKDRALMFAIVKAVISQIEHSRHHAHHKHHRHHEHHEGGHAGKHAG
jgi:hypothetical protein